MVGLAPDRTKAYVKLSTREAILKAAEDICATHGPEQAKIRELARAIGIKPASLYNHFSSREDVLAAVVESAMTELLPKIEQAVGEDPRQGVELISRSYASFFIERPGIARLVLADFGEVRGVPSFDANEQLLDRLTDLEKQVYQNGFEQDLFRNVHLSDVVMARIGMTLTMLSARWLRGEVSDRETAQTIGATVTEFMLRYLSEKHST